MDKYTMRIIFLIAMFLAFAIGGEKHFGRWRRGALLAIPLTIKGIFILPWYLLIAQIVALWAVYQALFYDDGIKAIYDEKKYVKGWLIIGLNGALIGLSGAAFMINRSSITWAIFVEIGAILGFIGVIKLSNDAGLKQYRDWLNIHMPAAPYLNFKDAWYVSSGLQGLLLGILLL